MGEGVEERLDGLAGEGAAAQVGDRARDHDGQVFSGPFEKAADGEERGLGVEGIEDGFDEEDVHSPLDEIFDLFGVGGGDLLEGDLALAGVVHIPRDRKRAVEGADGSGDENTPVGAGISGLAGQAGGGEVEFGDDFGEAVVLLRDGRGVEGVRLDDVRAGGDILRVNLANDLRLGKHEQIIVSLEILAGPIREAVAPVVGLLQFVLLDHRAHRSVQNDDALGQEVAKGFFGGGDHFKKDKT